MATLLPLPAASHSGLERLCRLCATPPLCRPLSGGSRFRPRHYRERPSPRVVAAMRERAQAVDPQIKQRRERLPPGHFHYYATCHPGLEAVVAAELAGRAIGAAGVHPGEYLMTISSGLSCDNLWLQALLDNTTGRHAQHQMPVLSRRLACTSSCAPCFCWRLLQSAAAKTRLVAPMRRQGGRELHRRPVRGIPRQHVAACGHPGTAAAGRNAAGSAAACRGGGEHLWAALSRGITAVSLGATASGRGTGVMHSGWWRGTQGLERTSQASLGDYLLDCPGGLHASVTYAGAARNPA